jgi:phosphoenolpyruvate carboxykinase (ATP)
MKRVEAYNSSVFLVNTGWTGGPYGTGSRFDIPTTRRIVNAIQNGELNNVETQHIPGLNLEIPKTINGVDNKLLNPIETWTDSESYQAYLQELVEKFQNNFKKFDVGHDIISAGPKF